MGSSGLRSVSWWTAWDGTKMKSPASATNVSSRRSPNRKRARPVGAQRGRLPAQHPSEQQPPQQPQHASRIISFATTLAKIEELT